MPLYHQDEELINPLRHARTRGSSAVRVATRQTRLSSFDMVIPLLCGVFVHVFYMALLCTILILYCDDYHNLHHCMRRNFEVYLILSLLIHACTLATNVLSICIAVQTKVLSTSQWLNLLLSIRLFLNVFEVVIILDGFYTVFIDQHNVDCFHTQHTADEILHVLVLINLLSNLAIVLLTWLILFCCCTKSDAQQSNDATDIIASRRSYNALLHRFCSVCFYDQKSPKLSHTFHEMGGLIAIISHGNPYDNLELTPSDIVTGLHLLRMLQKHYGLFDEKFYFPFHGHQNTHVHAKAERRRLSAIANSNSNEKAKIAQLSYFAMYSNAAYGIGLYSLSKPCSICCAPPCFLPTNFAMLDVELQRNTGKCGSCCEHIQIDNSNLKVFVQRTGIAMCDLLLAWQVGELHTVNFYVCIDRRRQSLVMALRGTMSVMDSVSDIECAPMQFRDVRDDCFVHAGIGKCALYVYNAVIENERILAFLRQHADYNVTICGHSLGAGVCVILSLLFKYGTHRNNRYFIGSEGHRVFRAYAIGPPPCIEREFALKISAEMSEYLVCIFFGFDIIPRLSFKGVVATRAAINRLLTECVQTPLWIYEKSITMKQNTVCNALKHDTKYCKHYFVSSSADDGDEMEVKYDDDEDEDVEQAHLRKNEILPGEDCFLRDVLEDVQNMEHASLENNLSSKELWSTRFGHVGYVFHAVSAQSVFDEDADGNVREMVHTENVECMKNLCHMFCKSIICNTLRCRICLDDENANYFIYRANPDVFCDKLLISPYIVADHMPQVYLNVLQNIHKKH